METSEMVSAPGAAWAWWVMGSLLVYRLEKNLPFVAGVGRSYKPKTSWADFFPLRVLYPSHSRPSELDRRGIGRADGAA